MGAIDYCVDFIRIEKHLGETGLSSIFNSDLYQLVSSGSSGWDTYKPLCGKERRIFEWQTLRYNRYTSILEIAVSPPYLVMEQNLIFYERELQEAISTIENSDLCMSLGDAVVKEIEFAVVLGSEWGIQHILRSHRGVPRCRTNRYYNTKGDINGMEFKGSGFKLKMYDPWKNFGQSPKKLSSYARKTLYNNGRHPKDGSIKFEFHYTKPEKLNGDKQLTVKDILTPDFDRKCREVLLEHYRSIDKRKIFRFPENKKDADTAMVILLALMLACDELNETYDEKINHVLNALSEKVLSPADKYSRKRSIKNKIKKLEFLEEPESLEKQLIKVLKLD